MSDLEFKLAALMIVNIVTLLIVLIEANRLSRLENRLDEERRKGERGSP